MKAAENLTACKNAMNWLIERSHDDDRFRGSFSWAYRGGEYDISDNHGFDGEGVGCTWHPGSTDDGRKCVQKMGDWNYDEGEYDYYEDCFYVHGDVPNSIFD